MTDCFGTGSNCRSRDATASLGIHSSHNRTMPSTKVMASLLTCPTGFWRLLLNWIRETIPQVPLKMENLPPDPKTLPPAFFTGDHLALDFVNSRSTPLGVWTEWLRDGTELLDWLEEAGAIEGADARRFREHAGAREALNELAERARTLREWLRGFVARHAGRELGPGAAAELGPLNDLLARSDSYWQVEGGGDLEAAPALDQGPLRLQRVRRWTAPSSSCSRSRRRSPTWSATKTSDWSVPARARAASCFSSTRRRPTPDDGAAWPSAETAQRPRRTAPGHLAIAIRGKKLIFDPRMSIGERCRRHFDRSAAAQRALKPIQPQ